MPGAVGEWLAGGVRNALGAGFFAAFRMARRTHREIGVKRLISIAMMGGMLLCLPGFRVGAAESEVVVTLQTEVQLSLETGEDGEKAFCGSGDIYMTTEDAYSH